MARMVATKASLSIRVDALSDADSRSDPQAAEIGITNRVKLESRLRALEHMAGIQSVRKVTSGVNGRQQPRFEMSAGAGSYNAAADSQPLGSVRGMLPTHPAPAVEKAVEAVLEVKEEKRAEREKDREERKKEKEKKEKKETKEKKEKRKSEAADVSMDVEGDESMVVGETKEERRARKEAKRAAKAAKKAAEAAAAGGVVDGESSNPKKRPASEINGDREGEDGEKKKKKKRESAPAA